MLPIIFKNIRHPYSTLFLHTAGMALVSTSDCFLEASYLNFTFSFLQFAQVAPQLLYKNPHATFLDF